MGKPVYISYSGGDKANKEPQHVRISGWKDEPFSVKVVYMDSKVPDKEFTFITAKILNISETKQENK